MPKNKLLGVVLMGCGGYLLFAGGRVAGRTGGTWFSQIMTGAVSDQALLFWVAGTVLLVAGFMVFKQAR